MPITLLPYYVSTPVRSASGDAVVGAQACLSQNWVSKCTRLSDNHSVRAANRTILLQILVQGQGEQPPAAPPFVLGQPFAVHLSQCGWLVTFSAPPNSNCPKSNTTIRSAWQFLELPVMASALLQLKAGIRLRLVLQPPYGQASAEIETCHDREPNASLKPALARVLCTRHGLLVLTQCPKTPPTPSIKDHLGSHPTPTQMTLLQARDPIQKIFVVVWSLSVGRIPRHFLSLQPHHHGYSRDTNKVLFVKVQRLLRLGLSLMPATLPCHSIITVHNRRSKLQTCPFVQAPRDVPYFNPSSPHIRSSAVQHHHSSK
jgi:hypothetical protein